MELAGSYEQAGWKSAIAVLDFAGKKPRGREDSPRMPQTVIAENVCEPDSRKSLLPRPLAPSSQIRHFQEQQKGQRLHVIAIGQAVIPQDVAEIPEFLNEGGGVAYARFECAFNQSA